MKSSFWVMLRHHLIASKSEMNIHSLILRDEKLLKRLTVAQKVKINALPYKVLSNGSIG
jgi:hypothetical protein